MSKHSNAIKVDKFLFLSEISKINRLNPHFSQNAPPPSSEAYETAKALEKDTLEHGPSLTWSKGGLRSDMERLERAAEIEAEHESRRARILRRTPVNPLRPTKTYAEDIDYVYAGG